MAMILKPSSYVIQRCDNLLEMYEQQRIEIYDKWQAVARERYQKSWLTRLGLRSTEPSLARANKLAVKDPYFAYLVARVNALQRLRWMADLEPEIYLDFENLEQLR